MVGISSDQKRHQHFSLISLTFTLKFFFTGRVDRQAFFFLFFIVLIWRLVLSNAHIYYLGKHHVNQDE